MDFIEKVKYIKSISPCLQKGKKAIEHKYRNKIKGNNFNGSINFDKCMEKELRDQKRIDYIIGHNNQSFFIEVHPAETSKVREVIEKFKNFKIWKNNTPFEHDNNYYWISTNRIKISRNSAQQKMLDKEKIILIKYLDLRE